MLRGGRPYGPSGSGRPSERGSTSEDEGGRATPIRGDTLGYVGERYKTGSRLRVRAMTGVGALPATAGSDVGSSTPREERGPGSLPAPNGQGGDRETAPRPRSTKFLAGGVVAHNEEATIERALASLLGQELPEGVEWSRVWVVASGCTDRTVEIARSFAARDARVSVVAEAKRTGKAQALREVLRRAEGDALVLLNSDAEAEPGAVRELLSTADGLRSPYAVMGRPLVLPAAPGRWSEAIESMWELHHRFHEHLASLGGGAHLSDELLLVSLCPPPSLPEGVINDGSYLGVWLAQNGAPRLYAPAAGVRITTPANLRDHLHQRRRIAFGNGQVVRLLGDRPSTLTDYALRDPAAALAIVRRSAASRTHGFRHVLLLTAAEVGARALALWDRLPPTRDHVRWQRIRIPGKGWPRSTSQPAGSSGATSLGRLEHRVATLVDIAARFRTGIALPDLLPLLPPEGPSTVSDARGWVEEHPDLARLVGDQVLSPGASAQDQAERRARGERFLRHGERLFDGPLRRTTRWLRCAAVTGSAAYGEPGPDDDLDLFVVVRTGALWWFLAHAFLRFRLERWRRGAALAPVPCINYAVEDSAAVEAIAGRRDFLAAREALCAKAVLGSGYYQGLLERSPWMAEAIPRLYRRVVHPGTGETRVRRAPLAVRVANALTYPLLAAYLQLTGLYRNARSRRQGSGSDRFRTVTRYRRMAFVSDRFESLRSLYEAERDVSEAGRAMIYARAPPTAR